jgi:large subunit ribosomal protein L19
MRNSIDNQLIRALLNVFNKKKRFFISNSFFFTNIAVRFLNGNLVKINIMDLILKQVDEQIVTKNEFPPFKAGDTITVNYKIKEGSKERIQQFRGVVIQLKGNAYTGTFTIRKMSGAFGVERIFPMNSPFIDSIQVNKHGRVRRARIYYIKGLTGKKARIKEKRF